MVKRPPERASDRFISIGLSVLVHAAIIGALFWGWWQYRHSVRSPPPTLAIEGTVVRHAPLQQRSPAVTHPSPAPTPPAPPPTPPVDQAKLARQHAAEEAAAAKLAADKQAADKLAAQKAAAAQQAQQQVQQQAAERAAAEEQAAKLAAAKAEAERAAQAKLKADEAARQAKLAAERKAKEEEAAREAQQLAQQLKSEQAEQQREADLRSQMQAEEHLDALQRGPAEAEYQQLISARISRAWVRPPSAQPGLKCIVHLTQIPGGEITNVTVEGCNGDEAVRQSVQTAAYRASPLPTPPDPALFDPNITVTFAPDQ